MLKQLTLKKNGQQLNNFSRTFSDIKERAADKFQSRWLCNGQLGQFLAAFVWKVLGTGLRRNGNKQQKAAEIVRLRSSCNLFLSFFFFFWVQNFLLRLATINSADCDAENARRFGRILASQGENYTRPTFQSIKIWWISGPAADSSLNQSPPDDRKRKDSKIHFRPMSFQWPPHECARILSIDSSRPFNVSLKLIILSKSSTPAAAETCTCCSLQVEEGSLFLRDRSFMSQRRFSLAASVGGGGRPSGGSGGRGRKQNAQRHWTNKKEESRRAKTLSGCAVSHPSSSRWTSDPIDLLRSQLPSIRPPLSARPLRRLRNQLAPRPLTTALWINQRYDRPPKKYLLHTKFNSNFKF